MDIGKDQQLLLLLIFAIQPIQYDLFKKEKANIQKVGYDALISRHIIELWPTDKWP